MNSISILTILPLLLGGLTLFLYAIRRLSLTMQYVFSEKVKKHIKHYTDNLFLSIAIGTVATILLDSSSAVIIIAIIFINAGTLNFKQVIGIVMGANIGTTFSSQLIAFNVSKYAIVPLVIGFLIWLFSKSSKFKIAGEITMYFGMLFFALYLLESSVMPLKDTQRFTDWLTTMSNPLKGAATGGLVTLIIQSSSATVAMLITLAKKEMITLSAALAAMLGAELGTCSNTLIAVIGGKRDALRIGVFHILFNLIPIFIGLLFFDEFLAFVKWLSSSTSLSRQIANAHVAFSILSIILFLPFVNSIYKVIRFIIPDRSIDKAKNVN